MYFCNQFSLLFQVSPDDVIPFNNGVAFKCFSWFRLSSSSYTQKKLMVDRGGCGKTTTTRRFRTLFQQLWCQFESNMFLETQNLFLETALTMSIVLSLRLVCCKTSFNHLVQNLQSFATVLNKSPNLQISNPVTRRFLTSELVFGDFQCENHAHIDLWSSERYHVPKCKPRQTTSGLPSSFATTRANMQDVEHESWFKQIVTFRRSKFENPFKTHNPFFLSQTTGSIRRDQPHSPIIQKGSYSIPTQLTH